MGDMPLIVHTVRNMSSAEGGVPESILNLLLNLNRVNSDFQLKILTQFTEDNILEDSELSPVTCHLFQNTTELLSDLNKIKSKNKIIIHDHGLWNPFNHQIATWANKNKVTRIITPHGLLEPWAMEYKSWKKKLAWRIYQKRDLQTTQGIHATATSEAHNLKKYKGEVPVYNIPWGIDLPPIMEKQKVDKKRILFLSRIQEKKGLRNLILAWSKINNPEWEIIIAGPNENNHQQELEQFIRKMELDHFFNFVGEVKGDHKDKLYRSADIFILPTFSENFGLVIGEALSYGIPVITTKGAPWELIEKYNAGYWIDIGVEPLTEALTNLMHTSPNQRHLMGQNGRRLIEEQYSWSNTTGKMINLYEKLI